MPQDKNNIEMIPTRKSSSSWVISCNNTEKYNYIILLYDSKQFLAILNVTLADTMGFPILYHYLFNEL